MCNRWRCPGVAMVNLNDIIGYDVVAIDGNIGKVDSRSGQFDDSHVVVDTGWWMFGRKRRLIPARMPVVVDHLQRKVWVDLTMEQIETSPDYLSVSDQVVIEGYHSPFGIFG